MILNDTKGTAVRVGDVRSMNKLIQNTSSTTRYSIELRFKHSTGSTAYRYAEDMAARDKDFEKLNSAMDALDGIQGNQQ